MKRIIMFVLLFAALKVAGQTTGYLRFDTVKIMKQNGTCELYLINKTKDSLGLLTNVGGGLTRFIKSKVLNDSIIVIGLDTLVVLGGAGSSQRFAREDNATTGNMQFNFNGFNFSLDSVGNYNMYSKAKTTGADRGTLTNFGFNTNNTINLWSYIPGSSTRSYGFNAYGALTQMFAAGHGPGHATYVQSDTLQVILEADPNRLYMFHDSVALHNITGGALDFRIRTLPQTVDTTNFKPLAIGPLGQVKMVTGWSGGSGGSSSPSIPSVNFSPVPNSDPSFYVLAAGIARTDNTYSPGNPITWVIIDPVTNHASSFYDSIIGSGSGITYRYPNVKNVLNTTITGDEVFATNMVSLGTSSALTSFGSPVIRPAVLNIRLTGNGTSTWSSANGLGLTARWSISGFSSGGTSFNIDGPATTIDYDGINIQYIGTNNYRIRRSYSGLGSYNVRFYLIDEFGNDVTSNPTSADEVIISAGAMAPVGTNMGTWEASNQFIDGFANFWAIGLYECWLVASPLSSTSTLVRWQNIYPSATNYKIYRATSLYGSRTLIHAGTDASYTDTGLSAGTHYWYFMIATVGGVDTEITYFHTATNP